MSFLYPSFLWALTLVAVPVIIHLFYFRRFRKVYFSNVRFLQEVKEETSMRSRLRNLLVLLLRCLAVIALVIAFAQPFIPVNEGILQGRKAISVYVDNSFSMAAESDRAPLLQVARDRARDIVAAYGPEDRFQVLTNAFSGRNQRLVGQQEALDAIDEIRASPESRRLSRVVDRQTAVLNTGNVENRISYLISDFQRNITDLEGSDTTLAINLVPLKAVQERNVAIDSAWFDAPVPQLNQNNLLLVRVRNYGDENLDNVRLSSSYLGQNKPEGTLGIPAGGSIVDSVYLNISQPGSGSAQLRITDYPVEFDDVYELAFRTIDRVRVLHIDGDNLPDRNLSAALQLGVFEATTVNAQNIDYGSLGNYELLILTDLTSMASGLGEQLRQYLRNGGNVLLFPPTGVDLTSYNAFLSALPADELEPYQEQSREVSGLNDEEFIFEGVYQGRQNALNLPATQANYPLTRYGSRQQEALLTYRDGSTALAKYTIGDGNLYLNSAPLDAETNNLGLNAEVFIPMLYKMGISSGRRRPLAYVIGQDEVIETSRRQSSAEIVYKLRGPGGEFIPQQRTIGGRVALSLGGQVPEAGVYELVIDEETVESFAFNYDRTESDLTYSTDAALASIPGVTVLDANSQAALVDDIRERTEGRSLWRYFIWATLIFLLAEALVLRFWKT
ncbi:putative membrane protein (TIGR02226 family) [Neolewinella xylanilytica]|uniref:Putative membrane protein (TIGR02226 family) n=1 Tax=Neolewinella xylanilytica TaxID=1514080 RepID=A0A2S6I3T9_9BACT|nr:BatA domain-containing protein [Neolewinella xylanilytica]PPK85830.1 putative membrane protein (TIGR02226 family) [Neolewinella xylanilytica]